MKIPELINVVNYKCPDIILIDENYCLNNSFDIIQNNFKNLLEKVNVSDDIIKEREVIYNRYLKNKEKYDKLLSYVTQFSGNWVIAEQTYNTYKNIWSLKDAPIEVVYPGIVDIENWGVYEEGVITEQTSKSDKVLPLILNWVNSKYPEGLYGVYEKINLRIYFRDFFFDTMKFSASYEENCEAGGGQATVCCTGCTNWSGLGHKGCNKSIINGRKNCGNMYEWCPGTSGRVTGFAGGSVTRAKGINNSANCATGSCLGWGEDFNKTQWKGKVLEVTQIFKEPDTIDNILLGHQIIKLKRNYQTSTNRWEWIREI